MHRLTIGEWFLSIFEVGLRFVRVNTPVEVVEIGVKRALNGHPKELLK